ncbi:MAG TPA: efflux RND transporter periplasmic adaptor subunit [Tepidisphaeraceae bacterium]|nr:efflux RND transporter periplasmic adaptor subunit [Tepidisphaeraceae bacterium]
MSALKECMTCLVLSTLLFLGILRAFGAEPAGGASQPDNAHNAQAVYATGVVEPENVVDVSAEVTGVITKMNVDFRSPVEAGTILAQIDDTSYQIDLMEARAKLDQAMAKIAKAKPRVELARAVLDRATKAVKAGADADPEVAQAKAAYEEALADADLARAESRVCEAAVRRAEWMLSKTVIRSPVKGIVIDRRVNLGQSVNSNLNSPSLFLIGSDVKQMELNLQVAEADVAKVRVGQKTTFAVTAFQETRFSGIIRQIRLNATMSHEMVSYTVIVSFDNPDAKLLPYMTAGAWINISDDAVK